MKKNFNEMNKEHELAFWLVNCFFNLIDYFQFYIINHDINFSIK